MGTMILINIMIVIIEISVVIFCLYCIVLASKFMVLKLYTILYKIIFSRRAPYFYKYRTSEGFRKMIAPHIYANQTNGLPKNKQLRKHYSKIRQNEWNSFINQVYKEPSLKLDKIYDDYTRAVRHHQKQDREREREQIAFEKQRRNSENQSAIENLKNR